MLGPNNLRDAKIPFVPLRPGSLRWYECYNSNLQSLVYELSRGLRRNTYVQAGDQSGKLVCYDPSAAGEAVDRVTLYDTGVPAKMKPTQVLTQQYATNEYFARTWGLCYLSASHGVQPGELGYLSDTDNGAIVPGTDPNASSLVAGVFGPDKSFLFMPQFH